MEGKETEREKHFVLVHGACHGAWCWYKVATLLKSSGHKVTALDMAASGVHPKQPRELNSIVEYVEPLFEFFEGLPQGEKVILVGHSAGGVVISMAMERFPEKIAVAVFAAAFMYGPEISVTSVFEEVGTSFYSDEQIKDKNHVYVSIHTTFNSDPEGLELEDKNKYILT